MDNSSNGNMGLQRASSCCPMVLFTNWVPSHWIAIRDQLLPAKLASIHRHLPRKRLTKSGCFFPQKLLSNGKTRQQRDDGIGHLSRLSWVWTKRVQLLSPSPEKHVGCKAYTAVQEGSKIWNSKELIKNLKHKHVLPSITISQQLAVSTLSFLQPRRQVPLLDFGHRSSSN